MCSGGDAWLTPPLPLPHVQEFVARVDRVSSDHLDVTLFDGETNINLELGGTATPTPAPVPAPAPAATTPKKVTFAQPVECAAAAPAVQEPRRVSVSFTVSPGEFYTQEATTADQLDELMTQLETEYTQLAEGERAVQEVGGAGGGGDEGAGLVRLKKC